MPGTPVANPIRSLGVGELVLRVADLERSIGFYRDVLEFPLIRVLQLAVVQEITVEDYLDGRRENARQVASRAMALGPTTVSAG